MGFHLESIKLIAFKNRAFTPESGPFHYILTNKLHCSEFIGKKLLVGQLSDYISILKDCVLSDCVDKINITSNKKLLINRCINFKKKTPDFSNSRQS